jgi:hypothetical protein
VKNFSFTVPLGGGSQTATVPGAILTAECALGEADSILNIAGTQAGETLSGLGHRVEVVAEPVPAEARWEF